jgi:type I site-specific restriction endonuclease
MKLYLQNILEDISFENLPIRWKRLLTRGESVPDGDFVKFSQNKTLFDFQQNALKNALKGLWLYFKDKNADKNELFIHYKLNGLIEDFDYDLKKKAENKTAKYLLEYSKDYLVINDKISFAHFINRMSFWMATGSGKTLIIVKLIEILGKLISERELPAGDILFLAHRDDLLEQFKNHVDEFNSFNFTTRINLKSLREYDSVKKENALPLCKSDITVFYYRSDLISDEHKEKIVNFKNYDNGGQ